MDLGTADEIAAWALLNIDTLMLFAGYLAALLALEGVVWAKAPVTRPDYWKGMVRNLLLLFGLTQIFAVAAITSFVGAQTQSALKELEGVAPNIGDAGVEMVWMAAVAVVIGLVLVRSSARLAAGRLIDIGWPRWIAFAGVFPIVLIAIGLFPSRAAAATRDAATTAAARKNDDSPWRRALKALEDMHERPASAERPGAGSAPRVARSAPPAVAPSTRAAEAPTSPLARPQRAVAPSAVVRGRGSSDGPAVRR